MTLIATCAIGWVLASTALAFLPIRHQIRPGMFLMATAPILIVGLGLEYGWIMGVAAALAFVSMYRNPLRYVWARIQGEKPEIPK